MKDEDWVDAIDRKQRERCSHARRIRSYEKGLLFIRREKCGKIMREIGYREVE